MTDEPTHGYALGVDLGTSHTVAVLRWPDGRTRALLFDGVPLLPSGVYLDQDGRLHVGRDAQRLAQSDPARYEPNPKRRIDEQTVLLRDREAPVVELLAATLGAVGRAAVEAAGFVPPVALTHPAAWGTRRREALLAAAHRAGWPDVRLVPEPVTAARHFTEVLRRPVPLGGALAIFDFGAGTLDVAVVRRETVHDGQTTFSVLGTGGLEDLGGLDLDAALVHHLGQLIAPDVWHRLEHPATPAEQRDRSRFWDDVRGAKEMLSRSSVAPVAVPGVDQALHLTREELERVAEPLLRRAVNETAAVIRDCGLNPADLAGLFLVGGSSRVPMVARLLHTELGIAPTVLEQPELPVAEGAVAELVRPGRSAAESSVREGSATLALPRTSPESSLREGSATLALPRTSPEAVEVARTMPVVGRVPVPPSHPAPVALPGPYPPAPPVPAKRKWLLPAVVGLVVLLVASGLGLWLWLRRDGTEAVTFRPIGQPTVAETGVDSLGYGTLAALGRDRAYLAWLGDNRLNVVGLHVKSGQRVGPVRLDETDQIDELLPLPDVVLVIGENYSPSARVLFALDPGSLEVKWHRALGPDEWIAPYDGFVVLVDEDKGTLTRLALGDGDVDWGRTFENPSVVVEQVPADQTGPANVGGGVNSTDGARRLVVIVKDVAHVLNPKDGKEVATVSNVDTSGRYLAYAGRLFVTRNESSGYRLEAYRLDQSGLPTALYASTGDSPYPQSLVPCPDGDVCAVERASGQDGTTVVEVKAGGGERWRQTFPRVDGVTPVGSAVLVVATGSEPHTWIVGADGKVGFDRGDRIGVRVSSGSVLLWSDFSNLGASSGLTGLTVASGDLVELGQADQVRATACSWSTALLACPAGKNLAVWRFAS